MTAATMLFASSCSKEQISSNAPVGEQVTVTLTADLGAIESRAISDGLSVNEVAWAIYLHGADKPLPELYGVLPISNKQGTLEVRLVTGKSYDIALFAYYKDGATTEQALGAAAPKFYKVDWDSKTIALNYPSPLANDTDKRDCFWYVKQNLAVDGPVNETFILTRPLAQLNFGVTKEDTTAAAEAGLVVSQSKIVASTYESFNMFTGECLGQLKEYTFAQNAVPQQELEVENIDYTYVGTAYLLVDEKETQEVSLTIYNNDANNTEINTLNYSYVPFQRNYRTNILGALLTNPIEFNIVVDERFNEPDYIVKHWDGTTKAVAEVNGTYTVTEPAELAWVAQQVNSGENSFEGKAVVLQGEVIDLNSQNNQLWTPIGVSGKPFRGSFDGNGVVIRNMKVSTLECAGLFGSVVSDEGIKNVILEDAVIESSHYAGAVAGYAYADIIGCTVNGLTMNVLPNDTTTRTATYDNGDKVGGIVGYVGEGGYKINGNTVEEATIIAYRDLGGIAGAAYIGECTGNIVKKSTLKVDQTVNDYGTKDANLDEVVGRVLGGTVGENTIEGVTLNWNPYSLRPCIENVIAAGVKNGVTAKGYVLATSAESFLLADETGWIMVYKPKNYSTAMPKEGDVVSVKGNTAYYPLDKDKKPTKDSMLQFAQNTVVTVLDEPKVEVTHPTSDVWTVEQIEAYAANSIRTFATFKGKLNVNNIYYNIEFEGTQKQGSIISPKADIKNLITNNGLNGKTVQVSGYLTYLNSSKYLNMIITDFVDCKEATEWGIVGDMTGWAKGNDIPMYTYGDNIMFARNVVVSNNQSFKIRVTTSEKEWDDEKNYGTGVDGKDREGVYTDMAIPVYTGGDSGNIKPAKAGTYDIYFDLNNKQVYVMTSGKSISDAAKHEEYIAPVEGLTEHEWGVVGSFNGWNVENYVTMSIEGDYAVAKGVTLANGDEFKFAADNDWALSYGSGCDVNIDTKYRTYNNGGNMKFVGEAGTYDIYFSMVNATFYMEEHNDAVEATITFDDKAKRTVFTTSQQVWVENGITVTNDKASSSSNIGNYAKPARFYKGSKVTIAAPGKIHSIKIDCTNMDAKYVTPWIASIGGNAVNENNIITVTLDGSSDSFVVAKTTAQIRANSMTITYAE